MALRQYLLELGAETLEIEGRAAEGQPGPVGALQAAGQIRGGDWHAQSIRRPEAARRRLIHFTPEHQSI
jgi:hypothetical protein